MTTSPPQGFQVSQVRSAVKEAAAQNENALYLGRGSSGWAWAAPERSVLVLGPSRSGKTSSLIVPNVLAAPGAVVSTSTKPDVLEMTAVARSGVGWTFLFDPSGRVELPRGVTRIGWSPIRTSLTFDGAVLNAEAMVRSARSSQHSLDLSHDSHWNERAASLLAPLLHAAALNGDPMSKVVTWVNRHQGDAALGILVDHYGEEDVAPNLLAGIVTTDPREQSGIWSTASGALSAYRSNSAIWSSREPLLDVETFCEGQNTLYICAPGRDQQVFAPLVVGLVSELQDAAYARSASGRVSPPLVLALDEVANIAPLPNLPSIVSEGPGQGLLTIACLQDLSQARSRWGKQADSFISLFGTTVVLSGIADISTLETLSALGGDKELTTRSVGESRDMKHAVHYSSSFSTIFRRRLDVDAIGRGDRGSCLALDAGNRLGWVELTPAHLKSPWRDLISNARDRSTRPRGDPELASAPSPGHNATVKDQRSRAQVGPAGRDRSR